jgi:NAD(P)-dependent dehydrogenase (short-subunit alcohol dehydrogenase family)
MLLADKVVIISGVEPGFGRKLALRCVQEGARLGISCRSTAFVEELEREILHLAGSVVAQPCDITVPNQCHAFAESVAEKRSWRSSAKTN